MSPRQKLNEEIAEKLEEMHTESPDKGYRRLRDDLEVYHNIPINAERVEYGSRHRQRYDEHSLSRKRQTAER